MGKITGEIADRARVAGVQLHAIVGQVQLDPDTSARMGLDSVTEATTLAQLEAAGRELGRKIASR